MSVSSVAAASFRRSGTALLALAGVFWGTGGLLGSLLGREAELSPLAVAAYRLGIGGLLVLVAVALSAVRGGRRPGVGLPGHRRSACGRIAVLAVLAAQFQACYFTAVSLSSIGLATLVTIGTAPIVVTGVEVARGRARRGAPATAVLALLGLGLLVGLPEAGPDPLAATSGAAAAVLAGSGFAVMTLIAARPVPGLDPTVAAGVAFFAGGLLLGIPLAAAGALTVPTTAAGLGLLVLLATIPTALAYTAYFGGLRVGASAGTAAVLALVEPLTAAVLAAVVLGERIGLIGTVGALMLALAVLRAARAEGRPGDTVG